MEKPSIPEIEDAAEHYRSVRDKRMKLTEQEITAKVNLLQVLLQHESELAPGEEGTKTYSYDEEIVILQPGKAGVKVKAARAVDGEEAD